MPPRTPPLIRRKGRFFGLFAGLVLLANLMCVAAQAQTLPQNLPDLGLSYFPDAARIIACGVNVPLDTFALELLLQAPVLDLCRALFLVLF